MCGIAGLLAAELGKLDVRSTAERMQVHLRHRGRDDAGIFVSENARSALAHTRLSILDLSSAGHQPMGLGEPELGDQKSEAKRERGRFWIVFNGEIYNYRSLREELDGSREGLGVRREGTSTTSKEHGAGSRRSENGNQKSENDVRCEALGVRRNATNAKDAERSNAISQRSAETQVKAEVKAEAARITQGTQYAMNAITQSTQQTQSTRNTITWTSNTDTEVILRAYARWGRDCVQRLRGMFAVAIWDEERQELFLARDPLGIKPLYYYQTDHLILFASEVRALLASGLLPRKLSQQGLGSYLKFGSVQDPFTIIDGVRSLLPGHCFTVKLHDTSLSYKESQYSNYDQSLQSPSLQSLRAPSTRAHAITLLRSKLEDSIRHHLISDVPLGAFLSGGIDSSVIVALMSRVAGQRPKTFSVVFEESDFSEGEHAKLVARRFGTEHHEILLSEQSLLDMLQGALTAMDQPTMDGINTYVVSKAVKEADITVALSGLGGDELFGGYPSFRRAMQLNRLATAPSAIRRFASTAGRMFTNGSSRYRKFWDLLESDCSPAAAYTISRQLFAPDEIAALTSDAVNDEALGVSRAGATNAIRNSRFEIGLPPHDFGPTPNPQYRIPDRDVVNAISRYELGGYMVNTLLRDTDQMSMAHALEVRVPFVDSEVVNYVMALHGEWKINGACPKPLLVDALGDLLPEEIWRRRKMGFTLPFQRWMSSRLASDIDETFSNAEDLARIGIEPDYARSAWHAFKKNPQQQPWSRPWALYVLAKWCDLNEVRL